MSCECKTLLDTAQVITGCECNPTGEEKTFYCARHDCRKTMHHAKLCRSQPQYFGFWERGEGHCLGEQAPVMFGLGDAVAWLLSKIGINPWPGCGCQGRKAWLNRITLWRRKA